jgi:hypothetical protein
VPASSTARVSIGQSGTGEREDLSIPIPESAGFSTRSRLVFYFFCKEGFKNMRLTEYQIQTICQLARQLAGSKFRLHVFGSRLDDAEQGGDIDLMFESLEPVDNPRSWLHRCLH